MSGTIDELLTWFPLKGMIELHYPFTLMDLEKFSQAISFSHISRNRNMDWNFEVIERFREEIWWGSLCNNTHVSWNKDIIDQFHYKINWQNALKNESFPWTKDLFISHLNRLDFNGVSNIPVRLEEKDFDLFNHEQLRDVCGVENLPWSEGVLAKYRDGLDWDMLSTNRGIPFNRDLNNKYWAYWYYRGLQMNPKILSDAYFFEFSSFVRDIDYSLVSQYKEDWTMNFLNGYESRLDWDSLSANEFLPWSHDLLERYSGKWNWFRMSGNTAVPWTIDLIEKYTDHWNWNGEADYLGSFYSLSGNPAIPWSQKLIERFIDRIGFGTVQKVGEDVYYITTGISSKRAVDWDIPFLCRYRDRWNLEALENNAAIYAMLEDLVGRDKILSLYRVLV